MNREASGSSHSTLDDLPSEKHDPLMDHLKNVDALSNQRSMEGLHQENVDGEYDLEAQPTSGHNTPGRSLTRADTAAWVTKHPSRIPDDGMIHIYNYTDCSYEEERIDLHCRI
jgi:hypothetical protein